MFRFYKSAYRAIAKLSFKNRHCPLTAFYPVHCFKKIVLLIRRSLQYGLRAKVATLNKLISSHGYKLRELLFPYKAVKNFSR